ncbi:hypothetical protein BG011_006809 [Mortierella polycephala]|uniref:C2H2-type domain-containing protein n=1 Tax=Mortierella polycephala TaxID=41804 RepID=A0A9P6QCV0_9FUNG|nr:hypothetical protein BG011_006809 [Mortierella polycephala]
MTIQAEAAGSILSAQGSTQGQQPSSPQRASPEMSIEPAPSSPTSLSTRPESQDTISQPLQEPGHLKQEYSSSSTDPLQSQPSAIESTHDQEEDEHDSEMESAAQEGDDDDEDEEEDDEDEEDDDDDLSENDEDQDQRHKGNDTSKRNRRNKRNGNNSNTRNEKSEIGNELSLSSDEDEEDEVGSSHPNEDEYSNLPEETLCRWKDCGKVLPSIAALVVHLSDEHIGWKKTAYTCEWEECDKSFSRSDAMAKHLKCQHGDVPERFTGRKSRGRYTMKDPAASSTLLHTSSFGARKRRRDEYSKSDAEMLSSIPAKLRKLGSSSEDRHHDYAKHSDQLLLKRLNLAGQSRRYKGQQQEQSGFHESNHEEDDDDGTDDSDFAIDNGQTPRERYGILKAKFQYIHNERESLETEYDDLKKKLTRLRVERELLLDALLASEEQHQDLALQDIEDSD